LVGATSEAGVISAKARLPIHRIVGYATLIVCSTGRARGERDSVLIPGARISTSLVNIEAGLPIFSGVRDALVIDG